MFSRLQRIGAERTVQTNAWAKRESRYKDCIHSHNPAGKAMPFFTVGNGNRQIDFSLGMPDRSFHIAFAISSFFFLINHSHGIFVGRIPVRLPQGSVCSVSSEVCGTDVPSMALFVSFTIGKGHPCPQGARTYQRVIPGDEILSSSFCIENGNSPAFYPNRRLVSPHFSSHALLCVSNSSLQSSFRIKTL